MRYPTSDGEQRNQKIHNFSLKELVWSCVGTPGIIEVHADPVKWAASFWLSAKLHRGVLYRPGVALEPVFCFSTAQV